MLILDGKKQHYLVLKKLFVFLWGIASKSNWGFYYLNCFYWFQTKKILWHTNQQRVTSYELGVNTLMSCIYCTNYKSRFSHELWVTFHCTIYKLLFRYKLRVTVYCTSYELLLLHELWVIVYYTSYDLLIIPQATNYFFLMSYDLFFIARVTSYFLTLSYNENKDDKAAYDNKVVVNN